MFNVIKKALIFKLCVRNIAYLYILKELFYIITEQNITFYEY